MRWKLVIVLLIAVFFLSGVGRYLFHPAYAAFDCSTGTCNYNSGLTHTRSGIYVNNNPTASQFSYNSTCVSFPTDPNGGTHIKYDYSTGRMSGNHTLDSYVGTQQAALDSTFTTPKMGFAEAFASSPTSTFNNIEARVKLRIFSGTPNSTETVTATIYAQTGSPGTTAKPTGTALATSDTLFLNKITSSFLNYQFNFSSSYTLPSNTNLELVLWANNTQATLSWGAYTNPPDTLGPRNIATSTGGAWTAFANQAQYYAIIGNNGFGANCASADIAILKSPQTFQTAAGSTLEINMAWNLTNAASDTAINLFRVFLTTNSSVPGFNEGYGLGAPYRDEAAQIPTRLVWDLSLSSSTMYSAHSSNSSIIAEGSTNDIVASLSGLTFAHTDKFGYLQAVLNFTGPNNWLMFQKDTGGATFSQTAGASQFQIGQSFYIGLQPLFGATQIPSSGVAIYSKFGARPNNGVPLSMAFYSVPQTCKETQNYNSCFGAAAPNPSVSYANLNLYDPSTWANAIVQGIVWAANQFILGVAPFIGFFYRSIIWALNSIGVLVGIGRIGDQLASLFVTLASEFTNVFGNFFAQALNLLNWIGASFSAISGLFASFWSNMTSFLSALSGVLGFVWTIIGVLTSGAGDLSKWAVNAFLFILAFAFWADFDYGMRIFRFFFDWVFLKMAKLVIWFGERTLHTAGTVLDMIKGWL